AKASMRHAAATMRCMKPPFVAQRSYQCRACASGVPVCVSRLQQLQASSRSWCPPKLTPRPRQGDSRSGFSLTPAVPHPYVAPRMNRPAAPVGRSPAEPPSRRTAGSRIDLLDPHEMSRLGGLEVVTEELVEGFLAGLHRSPRRGFGVEFAEHRMYQPGDELRYVDWKMLGRSDRL